MYRLIALLLCLAAPLRAEVAQIDLLPGWRDGARHIAGVQIALQPGWKTYWRAPGDAGIPPQFNWSGSGNLADVRVAWPTPHVFSQGGMRSVGYDGGVVLPLIITPRDPSQPVDLRLSMDIGVCLDICIPVTARLSSALTATEIRPDARIRAAMADRPMTRAQSGAGALTCDLSPSQSGVDLSASLSLPPMGGTEHAVIELSDPRLWVSAPDLRRAGNTLHLSASVHPPRGMAVSVDRKALRLTVLGQRGAVDVVGCD